MPKPYSLFFYQQVWFNAFDFFDSFFCDSKTASIFLTREHLDFVPHAQVPGPGGVPER